MAASFRSAGEVEALAGCDRVTVAPAILKALDEDHGLLVRRLSPDSPRGTVACMQMDERTFRWAMNEDAMATEKLAEGIRAFAKDLDKLRALIAHRLG
jgi:transaldolase